MSLSFFFNDTATTEIYTLSLHDALPISTSPDASGHTGTIFGAPARPHHSARPGGPFRQSAGSPAPARGDRAGVVEDRKSTRLNSSHSQISYAVFCLKKKKINVR